MTGNPSNCSNTLMVLSILQICNIEHFGPLQQQSPPI